MKDETGNVNDGEWKDDYRHGKGIFTYADGGIYDGDDNRHLHVCCRQCV